MRKVSYEEAMSIKDGEPPILDKLDLGKPYEPDEELYREIRDYVVDHVDFVEDEEYDITVLKILESWVYFKFKALSYVFMLGPYKSGKTRVMDVVNVLAMNPKFAATMSGPAVYRMANKFHLTLLMDELQQYKNEEQSVIMAVLNAGYRRGQKAWIMDRQGEGWEPRGFDVFCPKWLASTENTFRSLFSRCIVFAMQKNIRRVNLEIDEERAEKIKDKIQAWASKNCSRKMPDVKQLFWDMGFKDYRNIEKFLNIVALAPPVYRKRILDYAKRADDDVMEDDKSQLYAELYGAIKHAHEKGKWESKEIKKIWVCDVSEAYNDGREQEDRISNRMIGVHLINMGLTRTFTDRTGAGRRVSNTFMRRLKARFDPDPPQQILSPETPFTQTEAE